MPVKKTEQASIMLSQRQVAALATLLQAIEPLRGVPTVTIEETNLVDTISVSTKRGTTLINHNGNMWGLGGRGADSRSANPFREQSGEAI